MATSPVTDLQFHKLAEIIDATQCTGKTVLIAVAGGSATCKSTLVVPHLIQSLGLTDFEVIAQDDFQQGRNSKLNYNSGFGHDVPGYFEIQGCLEALSRLKNGHAASIPVYDFQKGVHSVTRIVQPKPVLIFEGLFAAYGILSSITDYVVYAESPLYARIIRRIIRNRYERYRMAPEYTFQGIFKVINAHNALVVRQKWPASEIIQVPFSFQSSIGRFNLNPLPVEWYRLNERYSFKISESEFIKVLEKNGNLRFMYIFQNNVFIDFSISRKEFRMLVTLDLNQG